MIGLGFIDDLISDVGLPLVKKGIKALTGIDIEAKELTAEDKQKLLDSQVEIMKVDFEKLKEGSMWLYQALKLNLNIPVLGPEEPAINRIRNEYIRIVLIKIPQSENLGLTKRKISKILQSFEAIANYRAIKAIVNVDFY